MVAVTGRGRGTKIPFMGYSGGHCVDIMIMAKERMIEQATKTHFLYIGSLLYVGAYCTIIVMRRKMKDNIIAFED